MKKFKFRSLMLLCITLLCVTAFSVTAFASEGCYASNENGNDTPSGPITNITVSTEGVHVPEKPEGGRFTPDGNMSLVDDILQENGYYVSDETEVKDKQFITVQSKNGNYFYLVIDRSGDTENVYFLNLVDEADLLSLLEDGNTPPEEPPVCICKDKCEPGLVNRDCPICSLNLSDCQGKEKPVEEKPIEKPEPQPEQPPAKEEKPSKAPALLMLLLLAILGGGAVYWLKFRKQKPDTRGDTDLDDYDYGDPDDDKDYEFEPDPGDEQNRSEE